MEPNRLKPDPLRQRRLLRLAAIPSTIAGSILLGMVLDSSYQTRFWTPLLFGLSLVGAAKETYDAIAIELRARGKKDHDVR